MNTLEKMIYQRKSIRSYTNEPLSMEERMEIEAYAKQLKPLYPEMKVHAEFVENEDVRCIQKWLPPQLLAIFSEEKEGAYENVGFMFQQLELYLQSKGLGVCWLGLGMLRKKKVAKFAESGLKCLMILAVGNTEESLRTDISQFKRKTLSEISDLADEKLEVARLAPSSTNSQPWYFVHEEEKIRAYSSTKGLLKAKILGELNRMDVGIALAHLYVSNVDTFSFEKESCGKELEGYAYIGSFRLL